MHHTTDHSHSAAQFQQIDRKMKGFISETDFVSAMAEICPLLSSSVGKDVFHSADIHGIDKVY